jgi:anti-sigma-K factor RskA
MTDHDRIEELLAARALSGLDAADAAALDVALAEHGPDCDGCHELERDFGEVAADLAMSLEPVPLRDGFEDQVMAAARATAAPREPVTVIPPARTWSRRIAMLAAAAALVLGGFALGRVTGTEAPSDEFQILRLQGEAPGSVSVAYRPGETGGLILGSDLPAVAGDDVYALWTITDDEPALVGCFSPDDGTIVESFDQEIDQADLMAITVEPPSCPDAPTTAPILTAEVETA